jgi:hypothetical protein
VPISLNGLPELLAGRCLRATRPLHFFRPDGPMPEAVELRLTIPPELGPEAELLAELRNRVRVMARSAHPASDLAESSPSLAERNPGWVLPRSRRRRWPKGTPVGFPQVRTVDAIDLRDMGDAHSLGDRRAPADVPDTTSGIPAPAPTSRDVLDEMRQDSDFVRPERSSAGEHETGR